MKFKPGQLVKLDENEWYKYIKELDDTKYANAIDLNKVYTVKKYDDCNKHVGMAYYPYYGFMYLVGIDYWVYHERCFKSWKQEEFNKELQIILTTEGRQNE